MLKNRVKRHRTVKRLVKRHMKDLTDTASEQLELTEEFRSETHSDESLLSHSLLDHCLANTADFSYTLCSRVTDDTSSDNAVHDSDSHSSNLVDPRYFDDFCYSESDDVMSTEPNNTQLEFSEFCEPSVGHLKTSSNDSLASELGLWAGKYNIRQNALAELLAILRKYHSLPKDPRAVVKTVRSTDIRTMKGHDNCMGEYRVSNMS